MGSDLQRVLPKPLCARSGPEKATHPRPGIAPGIANDEQRYRMQEAFVAIEDV